MSTSPTKVSSQILLSPKGELTFTGRWQVAGTFRYCLALLFSFFFSSPTLSKNAYSSKHAPTVTANALATSAVVQLGACGWLLVSVSEFV